MDILTFSTPIVSVLSDTLRYTVSNVIKVKNSNVIATNKISIVSLTNEAAGDTILGMIGSDVSAQKELS